jgi:predicted component of type VI protein secretion system
MTLFDIVSYRNLLNTMTSEPAAKEFLNQTQSLTHMVEASGVQIAGAVEQLQQAHNQVQQAVEQFEHQLTQLKQCVQSLIEQQEPEYFARSLELYNTGYRNEPADHVLNRRIMVNPDTASVMHERLRLYSKWQHPGMILRPAHALFVEDLVACDPMYFVDNRDSLLEITNSWFTPQYQARLRRYVVNDYSDQPLFKALPQSQFGLIYAVHFFEYHAWPALQKYLKECFDLLRPGGVLAFTYNNCDLARRVGMVEHYSGCYTPGRLVRTYASELGYETVFDFDDDTNTSWMELRRPGNYNSIRGGQTLAAILQRP